MFVSRFIRSYGVSRFRIIVNQCKNLKTSLILGCNCETKDFQLCIDVEGYTQDEITVRAGPEYVIVEGKLERRDDKGLMKRHFWRKFKLPDDCAIGAMESHLTPDGILKITAPRKSVLTTCESVIPIEAKEPEINVKGNKDLCDFYIPKDDKKS